MVNVDKQPVIEPAIEQENLYEQLLGKFAESLAARGREALEAREHFGPDQLESHLGNIPEGPARDQLRQREKFLGEAGLDESARGVVLSEDVARIEAAYLDKRFTIKQPDSESENGCREVRPLIDAYGKETLKSWIQDMVQDPEFEPQDLERVARFMFDADGLKAVNDLTGAHGKGDDYLQRIAEVLSYPNTETAKLLLDSGVSEVIPMTAGHGDEYSIMVRGDQPLDMEALDKLLKLYEQQIAEINVSDLVDFEDLDIQLAYAARTREEYDQMTPAEQAKLIASVKQDIPEGFQMHAKASGGVESLAQGILYAMDEKRGDRQLTGDEDYEIMLDRMMGGLWEAADQKMMADKTASKSRLKTSTDPHERAQYQIFSRNVDQRMANRELTEAQDELGELQAAKAALEQRLAAVKGKRERRQQLLAEKNKLRDQRTELPRDAYDEAMDKLDDELDQLELNQ